MGHPPEMVVSVVGWPDVAVALIAGLPGIIAAVAAISIRREVRTPSGTSIGTQVEDSRHVALANHYRIRALGNDAGVRTPTEAELEADKVRDMRGRRADDE